MSEVLRLCCSDGPDLIMLLTDDDAFTAEVQRDKKGEFIILPNGLLPKRKNRKVRLIGRSKP